MKFFVPIQSPVICEDALHQALQADNGLIVAGADTNQRWEKFYSALIDCLHPIEREALRKAIHARP